MVVTGLGVGGTPAHADKLLEETTELTGTIMYLELKVPGLVIGVIRNGETSVHGFGKIADGSDKEPDGDTLMRIGSITKVFCGATLASMVADGKVSFTDRLQDRLGWDVKIPERDGKQIRLIDLPRRKPQACRARLKESRARMRPRNEARRTLCSLP